MPLDEKRFLVFATGHYCGGWNDFHSACETEEEAIKTAKRLVIERTANWSHVVDASTHAKIMEFRQRGGRSTPREVYAFDAETIGTTGTLVHSALEES